MDVSFLQKNYLVVLLSVFFSLFATFILNLALPQSNEQRSYVKSSLIAGLVSAAIVYIHSLDSVIETINQGPVPF
jgi:hypothetical protein